MMGKGLAPMPSAPADAPDAPVPGPTVQWTAQYLHVGRAPMLLEGSDCGQLRCTSIIKGKVFRAREGEAEGSTGPSEFTC